MRAGSHCVGLGCVWKDGLTHDAAPGFCLHLPLYCPVFFLARLCAFAHPQLDFTCSPAGLLPYNPAVPDALKVCPVSTGVAYLESSFQTRTDGIWRLWNVLILFGFNLLCLVVTVIQMSALKPQGYRYRAPENAVDPDVRSCPRVAYDYHVSRTSATSLPEGAMAVRIASARDTGVKNGARADEGSSRSSTGASSSGDKPAGDGTKAALAGGHGAVLTFSELCYTVESNGEPKQLLDNVLGYAEHGKMLALMGSSGAGKTTLLDVLAQRKTGGETTGSVLLNGVQAEPLSFARLSGYVEQSDLHVKEATVREALEFSAALRGGREVSDAEKAERVEGAMDKLQLRSVQDLLVQQLSPSHLKKLTIGIELVGIGSDAILFLDEPTSGLDGRDALSVITSLQLIAADRVAIVCTVHQPSKELFASFDRLLLLSRGGKMVYMGDLDAAEGEPHADEVCGKLMAYFEDHGAEPLPPRRNPADHMVRLLAGICRHVTGCGRWFASLGDADGLPADIATDSPSLALSPLCFVDCLVDLLVPCFAIFFLPAADGYWCRYVGQHDHRLEPDVARLGGVQGSGSTHRWHGWQAPAGAPRASRQGARGEQACREPAHAAALQHHADVSTLLAAAGVQLHAPGDDALLCLSAGPGVAPDCQLFQRRQHAGGGVAHPRSCFPLHSARYGSITPRAC